MFPGRSRSWLRGCGSGGCGCSGGCGLGPQSSRFAGWWTVDL